MSKTVKFLDKRISGNWEAEWTSGIETLDWEPVPAREQNEIYPTGKILGPFIYIQDKKSGVEPGFEAYVRDERYEKLVSAIISKHITKKPGRNNPIGTYIQRLLKRNRFGTKKLEDFDKLDPKIQSLIYKLVEKNEQCAKYILKILNKSKLLPKYLIKQDYNDPPSYSSLVSISTRRAMLTSGAKSLKEKYGVIAQKIRAFFHHVGRLQYKNTANSNGFIESLSTRLASASGMTTQVQGLCCGLYKRPPYSKLLSITKLAEGFSDFEGRIYGGNKKYGNYLVAVEKDREGRLVPKRHKDGYFHAEHTIQGLGENLAALLRADDYDAFGTEGGNKGFVKNQFFGIDFGHAYQRKNLIVKTLQDDFSFTQPSKNPIKNISVLYDTTLSEKMKGIHCLYKQRGWKIPQNVLDDYKKHDPVFFNKLNAIEENGDIRLLDEYISKARKLENKPNGKKDLAFKGLTAKLEKRKKRVMHADEAMQKIFSKRVGLTAEQLDFIDNMEKFSSETTHLSPNALVKQRQDEVVKLNHLRVNPKKRVICQLQQSHANSDHYRITLELKDKEKATQLKKDIIKFGNKFSKGKFSEGVQFIYDVKEKKLIISCSEEKIQKLMRIFNENAIAQYKHQPTLSLERSRKKSLTDKPNKLHSMPKAIVSKNIELWHFKGWKNKGNININEKDFKHTNHLMEKLLHVLNDKIEDLGTHNMGRGIIFDYYFQKIQSMLQNSDKAGLKKIEKEINDLLKADNLSLKNTFTKILTKLKVNKPPR